MLDVVNCTDPCKLFVFQSVCVSARHHQRQRSTEGHELDEVGNRERRSYAACRSWSFAIWRTDFGACVGELGVFWHSQGSNVQCSMCGGICSGTSRQLVELSHAHFM